MRTPNIPFINMKKKNTLNYPKSAAMGFFFEGLKNVIERAVVKEPSVFEPLKFYCNKFLNCTEEIRDTVYHHMTVYCVC